MKNKITYSLFLNLIMVSLSISHTIDKQEKSTLDVLKIYEEETSNGGVWIWQRPKRYNPVD